MSEAQQKTDLEIENERIVTQFCLDWAKKDVNLLAEYLAEVEREEVKDASEDFEASSNIDDDDDSEYSSEDSSEQGSNPQPTKRPKMYHPSRQQQAVLDAITSGAGIGFLPFWEANQHADLVEVMPAQPEWTGSFWLVTHMALHRTAKVQAFLTHLKEQAADWEL